MVPPQRDGMVAEEGAQPCVTAGVEGEARCVRAGGGGGQRRRGGEEDGEGDEEDGRRQRRRPTVPPSLPSWRDAAPGEIVGGNPSAAPPPSPAPAWRYTMGIQETAAMAVAYSTLCGIALVDDASLSAVCRRALNTLEEMN